MTVHATVPRLLPGRRALRQRAEEPRAESPIADNAVIVGREDLSDFVARFRIRPDDRQPPIEPGQYLTLGVTVDGRLLQRPYSTATGTGDQTELEFLIRRVPGGALTPLLWQRATGDRLRIGRPKGRFTRIAGDRRTHLYVATGTGLAPFVAMLETSFRQPDPPRAVVVHGVAQVAELAYRERFEQWSANGLVTYVPSISRPGEAANTGWTGRTGRVDTLLDELCSATGISSMGTVAYLCGNPLMIRACEQILRGRGLPPGAIRSEHYWPV